MTMRPEDIKLLRDAAYWVGRRPADDRYTEVARISRSLDELADRLDASNAKCARPGQCGKLSTDDALRMRWIYYFATGPNSRAYCSPECRERAHPTSQPGGDRR